MTDAMIPVAASSTDVLAAVPQMMELARMLKGASGLIPEHLRTEGQILATILAGRELGLGPMAAMRGLHVVKGKVFMDYSLSVALLKDRGYRIEWPESSTERVVLKLTDPRGAVHVETWDKERAQKAGLWNAGQGWQKYPETMLRARAVSSAGRAFGAEVLFGCYSMDEKDEIQGNKPAAPAPVTGTDRLTAKLAAAGLPVAEVEVVKPAEVVEAALEPVLLEEILGCFDNAKTLQDLDACKDAAKQLKGTDLKTARDAYRARKAEIEEDLARLANAPPEGPNF